MKIVQVKKDFDTIKELAIDKDIPIQVIYVCKYRLPYYKIPNDILTSSISYVKDMSIKEIQNAITNKYAIFVYVQDEEDSTNGKKEEF